ncbi:hypothetical protein HMI54_009406, partial [Coelomomyces lativittatus]
MEGGATVIVERDQPIVYSTSEAPLTDEIQITSLPEGADTFENVGLSSGKPQRLADIAFVEGRLEVGQERGAPCSLYYHVHGTGPHKIFFIM